MTKWYTAARFEDKLRIREMRERLRDIGHDVVSTWMDETLAHTAADAHKLATEKISPEQAAQYALRDLMELKSADGIILDTFGDNVRGGREVEWGIMLMRPGVRRIIVGPKRNVFHEMCTAHFITWDDLLIYLKETR